MAKGSRRYPISTVANENFMYIFGNCIGCIVQAGVAQRAPLEAEGGYLNVPLEGHNGLSGPLRIGQ